MAELWPIFLDKQQISLFNYQIRKGEGRCQQFLPNSIIFPIIIIQKMATTPKNSKTVENYILDSIQYINPDESEVWLARHKILNKSFMIKKFKYVREAIQDNGKGECRDEANAIGLQKIMRQVELLKTGKIQGAPKCHKMIKTTNNIYIIYEFAGISLAELVKTHLKSSETSKGQKYVELRIMLLLAKKLSDFHRQQILFLQLSPDNIFVKDNEHICFNQWSLSILKNNPRDIFPIANTNKSEFIANQVNQESQYSTASDIFSLGKIFTYIIHYNQKSNKQTEFPNEIHEITARMIDRKVSLRPKLQQIIQILEKSRRMIDEERMIPQSSKIMFGKKELLLTQISTSSTLLAENSPKQSHIFSHISPSMLREKSSPQLLKNTNGNGAISFDNILAGMSRATSQISKSRVKKNSKALSQSINKNRNLSFFILGLSEFAIKRPEGQYLGFLLLKHSYRILNNCYLEWKNEDFKDKYCIEMCQVLRKEATRMNLSLNMMKQYFLASKIDSQLRTELRNDLTINEKYYREQILTFSSEFMKQTGTLLKQNKVANLNSMLDDFFSVYMILKHVEEGSFERYWDKVYSLEYAFLKNQRHFSEEKRLGHRYIRSKIAQILNKR